jgi:Rrf2 family transcriptional regulator, iron-sulfur cluster assembly transcription factor
MLFSKTCEYGLQAMLYLAVVGKKVGITEISEKQDLPNYYLSKILQSLVKAKLVDSAKGPTGGFWLSKPLNQIRLANIVDAIDGMDILDQCGLGLKECDSKQPCAIHEEFKPKRESIIQLFYQTTLQDIVEKYEKGECVINLKGFII